MGALDFVKKSIRAKHGHGAIIDTKKEGYALVMLIKTWCSYCYPR